LEFADVSRKSKLMRERGVDAKVDHDIAVAAGSARVIPLAHAILHSQHPDVLVLRNIPHDLMHLSNCVDDDAVAHDIEEHAGLALIHAGKLLNRTVNALDQTESGRTALGEHVAITIRRRSHGLCAERLNESKGGRT